jgi:hypothetical protein
MPQDLPGYFFRDDALLLQGAIQNYVQEYVAHYYGSMHCIFVIYTRLKDVDMISSIHEKAMLINI